MTCKILPYEKLVTRGAAFNGKRADARDVARIMVRVARMLSITSVSGASLLA